MKIYTVYNLKDSSSFEDAKYIREGFSFKAGFFNLLWLFFNQMWRAFFTILFMFMVAYNLSMQGLIDWATFFTFSAAICIYLGYNGNDLLRNQLERRGYYLCDLVSASSEEEAEFRFLQNYININE